MLAASLEEAEISKASNARRWFIGDLPWVQETIAMWVQMAKQPAFSNDMIEAGDDKDAVESLARMMYDGLKQNRFLYQTMVDVLIA